MTTTEHRQELQREEGEQEQEQELAVADLDLPEERAGEVTGGTRDACEDWGCGTNHNEVLTVTRTEPQLEQRREEPEQQRELAVADLELPEERAGEVAGGAREPCEEWGCGSNHNEVLAVTA